MAIKKNPIDRLLYHIDIEKYNGFGGICYEMDNISEEDRLTILTFVMNSNEYYDIIYFPNHPVHPFYNENMVYVGYLLCFDWYN